MIVNRAFISEVLRTALAVTFVIISIFLVTRVMGFLGDAAEGTIPVDGVLSLVMLKMASHLDIMLPLMFYIALIMVLNRWYSDQEMAVLASSGVGIVHFLNPLAWLVFFIGGMIAFFSFYLTPLSVAKGYQLEQEYRQSSEVSGIITGRFAEIKSSNVVYFVEDYNRQNGNYENIFVYHKPFEVERVVVSKTAFRMEDDKTQDQFLVLVNGSRYEGNPGQPDYRVVDFERYAIRIEPRNQTKLYYPIGARANSELRESSDSSLRGEWYWRVAKVFTLPVLAIFALALSYVDSRRGKSAGMVLAFVVYLTYNQMLGYTVTLIKKSEVNDGSPMWLVHAFYFVLACYCLYRRNYNLPMMPEINLFRRKAG